MYILYTIYSYTGLRVNGELCGQLKKFGFYTYQIKNCVFGISSFINNILKGVSIYLIFIPVVIYNLPNKMLYLNLFIVILGQGYSKHDA